jgi:hypothetical protein
MKRIKAFALAVALALGPGLVSAAEGTTSLEELVSKMANTPEEHEAVADYFRGKAQAARGEVETHKRMARSYGGGKASAADQMKAHCDRIADAQSALAKEYEELAKLHEAEAEAKAKEGKPAKP